MSRGVGGAAETAQLVHKDEAVQVPEVKHGAPPSNRPGAPLSSLSCLAITVQFAANVKPRYLRMRYHASLIVAARTRVNSDGSGKREAT